MAKCDIRTELSRLPQEQQRAIEFMAGTIRAIISVNPMIGRVALAVVMREESDKRDTEQRQH
jgi:hypothetical protein